MNAKKTLNHLLKIFFIGGLPTILLFGVIIIALVPYDVPVENATTQDTRNKITGIKIAGIAPPTRCDI